MADNYQLKAVLVAVDKLTPVLKSVQDVARITRGQIDSIAGALGTLRDKIAQPLSMIAGIGSAAAIEGIRRTVLGFVDLGSSIADNAKRVGVSTDEYQRLMYYATMSGTTIESLSGAFGKLNKNIAEGAAGKNGEFARLLARRHIALRDAKGQLRTATDLLPQISELFHKYPNAALRARMGNTIFGKSWADVLPMLDEGKEKIDEMNERFNKLGISMGKKAVKAADDLGDSLDELHMVARSYGNEIGARLAPGLKKMTGEVMTWAIANRALITTKTADWILDVAKQVAMFDWSGFLSSIRSAIDGVKRFVDWIGGAKNALIALAVVMNAQTIVALVQLGSGLVGLGVSLVGIAVKAWTGAAGMLGLAASTDAAAASSLTLNARLATLLGTVGALAAAAAPLAAMWGVSKWAEDTSNDTGRVDALQGVGTGATGLLGMFGFDKAGDIEARRAANRTGLITSPEARVGGEIKVTVEGPPGTRAEQRTDNPAVPLRLDLGINPFALGVR